MVTASRASRASHPRAPRMRAAGHHRGSLEAALVWWLVVACVPAELPPAALLDVHVPPASASAERQKQQQTALVVAERNLWLATGAAPPAPAGPPDLVISEHPGGGQRYALRLGGGELGGGGGVLRVDIGTTDDKQGGLGSHVWGSSFAVISWLARPQNRPLLAGKKVVELGAGLGLTGPSTLYLPSTPFSTRPGPL
eukprot:SAG22_NODE_792_length_7198_cov_1.752641_3_plen_197_part_00